jgi:hypothetical protein
MDDLGQASSLPSHFCWTRFGTEAGESIYEILRRKEVERQRNGGIFLWGIGNALGPSMRALLRVEATPRVIFSPIRAEPRASDVSPEAINVWTTGVALDGVRYVIPEASVVTSRVARSGRPERHYALVCWSDRPLRLTESSSVVVIRNAYNLLTSNRVGSSQVTAVVRYDKNASVRGAVYPIALRARLVAPFFVHLTTCHVVSRRERRSSRNGGVLSL